MTTEALVDEVDQESPDLEDGFNVGADEDEGVQKDGALKLPDPDKKAEKKEKPEQKEEKEEKTGTKDASKEVKTPDENKDKDKDKEQSDETEQLKTAAERAEEVAKQIETQATGNSEEQSESVLDLLPSDYADYARKVIDSDEFNEFVKSQPKSVQKSAGSGDVDDAIYVLDLFKASQEKQAQPESKSVNSLISKFGSTKFTAPDGTQKTIKALTEEYGNEELVEAIAAMADAMASERVKGVPKSQFKPEQLEQMQARIDAMAAGMAFWESVHEAHPDAKSLTKSGKIGEWIKGQSLSMNRLYNSPDPSHAILVLDAYKESIAKEHASDSKEKSVANKRNIDSLHGESPAGRRQVKSSSKQDGDEDEEFSKGFEEGMK